MKYTRSHEWVDVGEDNIATVGMTQYAQKEVGEIVFVELPMVGKHVQKGQEVAVLESTKAAIDLYSPLSGLIIEGNAEFTNQFSEKQGWIFKLKLTDPSELDALMDSEAYQAYQTKVDFS